MNAVVAAAERFGFQNPLVDVLTDGLIHKTYKITNGNGSVILQQINTNVFKDVDTIVSNYSQVYDHLSKSNKLKIPAMLKTRDDESIWIDPEGSCWRAFEFIANTYTEILPASADKIFSAAKCYGEFTASLNDLDINTLKPTISGFHDLANRYDQLQHAGTQAAPERLNKSQDLLAKIEQRKHLVGFYTSLKNNPAFTLRAMHHDTKLSNILFDKTTQQAVCPIDLDTVMPGYFFSDVGDMVRSMISAADEDAPAESVRIDAAIYRAILSGYAAGIGNTFTETEKQSLPLAGQLMLYMQGIRFLTDYLNNDVYYKTGYPEQNFHRAFNQLTLLAKLEAFINAQ